MSDKPSAISVQVDSYDFDEAIGFLMDRRRFADVLTGRRINQALDAITSLDAVGAQTEGWCVVWQDAVHGNIVVHVDAGPKLLALCTDLIEGRP